MSDDPMSTWAHQQESVLGGRGMRHSISAGPRELTFEQALELLRSEPAFREFLSTVVRSSEYVALRWEAPPITRSSITRAFEFVVGDDPSLAITPEPAVFASYFELDSPSTIVRVVPNLGRTAQLVVPRELVAPGVYTHLLSFLKGAPAAQVHAVWQCVAETARVAISDAPLWISTAGGGVSWLHVRIEGVPKYYVYRPYRDAT